MERRVKDLLRTILSRRTLNTGAVKQMTIRSPIGMNGMAERQAKLAVEAVNPYTESKVEEGLFMRPSWNAKRLSNIRNI